MNPITKALDELKYRIPAPVLRNAFKEISYSWRRTPITIDEQILNKVIRPRVLVDCNLAGGTEVNISLQDAEHEIIDQLTAVYYIPKEKLDGRTITSVLSVGYINYTNSFNMAGVGYLTPSSASDLMVAASNLMNSHSSIPPVSTARAQIIGENTIMVKDNTRVMNNNYMRVIISDDENMNHLQKGSYLAFAKLVELAVKSYIYNHLYILMDKSMLDGGMDLGAFKEVIDGYADAEDMYQEYLSTRWRKIAFMNDNERMTRFIKLAIGGMK